MELPILDEEEMQMIYNWVDEIPLSRPKRNIARDFSDGGNLYFSFIYNSCFHSILVLMAEVVKHFIPHLVEIHNYSAAHSVSQKTYNWNTLNQKVFKKIGFTLTKKDIDEIVSCAPDTVERVLKMV
jgi:RNA recognition motif-containing protein